jgi:hypothetical protein
MTTELLLLYSFGRLFVLVMKQRRRIWLYLKAGGTEKRHQWRKRGRWSFHNKLIDLSLGCYGEHN